MLFRSLGQVIDARCDLYSLGVMLYEMLTGDRPYRADTAEALLDLHIQAPVPQLESRYARLQPVLDQLMSKDRGQRYASAGDVLEDLARRGL